MAGSDSTTENILDRTVGVIQNPSEALGVLADWLTRSEAYFSIEASGLLLLGALAAATGGRLLIVLAVGVFALTLMQQLDLINWLPVWLPDAFAVFLGVALLHLIISLFLGEQTAGTILAAMFIGLIVLAVFKPLSFLRIPGLGKFINRNRRR